MKIKIILILFMAYVAIGCNSNNDKKAVFKNEIIPDTFSTSNHLADSSLRIINRSIIWTIKNDSGKEKLTPPNDIKLDTLSSQHLIQLINENFSGIHLDLIKVSHDTMYVKIPDSKKLTQGLGDSGAENYLASATYTLTELKNIKFVNIAMEPGDHAEPGVYCRNDFKRLK